jgi:hypothetical protein
MKKLILEHIGRWFGEELRHKAVVRSISSDQSSLGETRRNIAVFASEMMGAQSYLGQFGGRRSPSDERRLFRHMIEQSLQPYMVIDPRPGLHIVDVSVAYARTTLTPRNDTVGRRLFDVFPDNPGDPSADGVANLY